MRLPAPSCFSPPSEVDLHRKLYDARPVHCSEDGGIAGGDVDHAIILLERVKAGQAGRLRTLECRVVKDVEKLCAELGIDLFSDLGFFDKGHIPVFLEWSPEAVAGYVAYCRKTGA